MGTLSSVSGPLGDQKALGLMATCAHRLPVPTPEKLRGLWVPVSSAVTWRHPVASVQNGEWVHKTGPASCKHHTCVSCFITVIVTITLFFY